MLNCADVAVCRSSGIRYPDRAPYHPCRAFPEYPFRGEGDASLDPTNHVYELVRFSLQRLGLDPGRFDAPEWNPLGSLIRPGETVVIKPNAVSHRNLNPRESVFAVITHGSVLRAVVDYAYIALGGRGRIVIADAPLVHTDFDVWRALTGVDAISGFYRERANFPVDVLDLRTLYAPWDDQHNYPPAHLQVRKDRDPRGYAVVDLGSCSEFAAMPECEVRRMVGSDPDRSQTVRHHLAGRHEYHVARTVLAADVLISVPKLKTHRLVGMTVNLKGMVGTQGDKNYIPHYRLGPEGCGGDEHPDMGALQNQWNRFHNWLHLDLLSSRAPGAERLFEVLAPLCRSGQTGLAWLRRGRRAAARRLLGRSSSGPCLNVVFGGWHGNDTAWRMALDLTRIALYADKAGQICETPQRRFFSVVDGVIAGDGEGPLAPAAVPCGVILAGCNPLAVDAVAARLAGFDPRGLRLLAEGLTRAWIKQWPGGWENVRVLSDRDSLKEMLRPSGDRLLGFRPPEGWEGRIEAGACP